MFEPLATDECQRVLPRGRRAVDVVAVHSGLGGRDRGSALGPAALRDRGAEAGLEKLGLAPAWHHLRPDDRLGRAEGVIDLCRRIAGVTEAAAGRGRACLVLGGDHSCAMGTWSGIASAARRPGLVWIDAHLDAHTPQTSPSGNWHGMPLAHLLGRGHPALLGLARPAPALVPEGVCLLAGRSFEAEEAALLADLGVRTILQEEIDRDGLASAMGEALAIAGGGGHGFGVSIDLDAVDPAEAPGVGSPVPGGLSGEALAGALRGIALRPGFRALEIVELNPPFDKGARTADLAWRLLEAAFTPGDAA